MLGSGTGGRVREWGAGESSGVIGNCCQTLPSGYVLCSTSVRRIRCLLKEQVCWGGFPGPVTRLGRT